MSKVLREKLPDIPSGWKMGFPKKADMYNRWIVVSDPSVCGVGSSNISKWVQTLSPSKQKEYNSYGIELVSPVFKTDSGQGEQEIRRILEALKEDCNGGQHGAFVTNQCGLHVHVQAPSSLGVFRVLAMLIPIYEDQIARLHAPCRHPRHENTRGSFESNRLRLLLEREVPWNL